MQLNSHHHLAYCTNVHPAESWAETLRALERWTLVIKERVSPRAPYGIGLRLSDQASRELSDPATFGAFQRWLDEHGCHVFTINGFPFGQFHGTAVKERVYRPDWTDPLRLDYTKRLFDLLARLLPPGMEGSVSTLPGSFKEFITAPEQLRQIQGNLWRCVEHVASLSEQTGHLLHLGLEPEPCGLFENSEETVVFFDRLREDHPGDPRLARHLGVNYDACHFAAEFEEPQDAVGRLQRAGIRLSKIHVSNALGLRPEPGALNRLRAFEDGVYLHQVIVRQGDGSLVRFRDLDRALDSALASQPGPEDEWRVHFHIPLHCQPPPGFDSTSGHLAGLLRLLQAQPDLCAHLEMETYTWSVLPEALKTRDLADQIIGEYDWMLGQLEALGLLTEWKRR